jgi:hypothetical protein
MQRSGRLRAISRVCYYLGWAAAAIAIGTHLMRLDVALTKAINVSGRNLLEASLLLFIICVASEARASGLASEEKPATIKAQAA